MIVHTRSVVLGWEKAGKASKRKQKELKPINQEYGQALLYQQFQDVVVS